MFDNFKDQRASKQNPEEEYSFHLWHIAAGDNDRPDYEQSVLSFWGFGWNNVPAELQQVSALF